MIETVRGAGYRLVAARVKRLATIRAVTTAVATIVVAVALAVGAMALVAVLRRTMINEVTELGPHRRRGGAPTRDRPAADPRGRRPATNSWFR